jgi:hypothetical protein
MKSLLEVLGVYEEFREEFREIYPLTEEEEEHYMESFGRTIIVRVHDLISAGLLEWADPLGNEDRIRVTPLLQKIQNAMDLSLTFLASTDHRRSMAVQPLFGKPEALIEELDVFVLMPFKADMLPVYEDHIKPTCASLNLTVRRDDDFFTVDSVINHIWKAIASARLIVADCTDRNPNVFYETGMAHTIGKPTILITQKSEDVPFDLRHLRYIPYQLTPRGMKEFEQKFQETLRSVLGVFPSAK